MILYHTTSFEGAELIKKSGSIKPKNYDSFVSFSEEPFTGDIWANDVILQVEVDPALVEKVEYTKRWYEAHLEQAAYIAGEGWRELFERPDLEEDEEPDQDLEDQMYQEAELQAFLDKSREKEWIAREQNTAIPVKIVSETIPKQARECAKGRVRKTMKKESQVLTGPAAPTERNPASFNRSCPICGWESGEAIEGCSAKFAKCPKCGGEMDQPFIVNTAPADLELLKHESRRKRRAQAVKPEVDINVLKQMLSDQGVDQNIADEAAKLIQDKTKNQPSQNGTNAIKPVMKPISTKLKALLNNKYAWGDEPARINFGPDYAPPRLAEADEKQEIDMFHADEPEMTTEEVKKIGEQIGINWEEVKFNPDDFLMGYNIELEHGAKDEQTNVTDNDPEKTAKIAWAHLKEDPKYYQKLKRMEQDSHEVRAAMHRHAVTIRELQQVLLPQIEDNLFMLTAALQNNNVVEATELLLEVYSVFSVVKDKINALGDVDPMVFGPQEPEKPSWIKRLIEPAFTPGKKSS